MIKMAKEASAEGFDVKAWDLDGWHRITAGMKGEKAETSKDGEEAGDGVEKEVPQGDEGIGCITQDTLEIIFVADLGLLRFFGCNRVVASACLFDSFTLSEDDLGFRILGTTDAFLGNVLSFFFWDTG
ncbi:hypothetical protein L1987_54045 [Smallanthus sonchifolius]|uniref:Uncharacterized protein n=1 Tax=Smallanthus sonchifolius TaxID=185202 RepID=A0ACB9E6H6_9ASTR|nr:hypothetical protein L1987_54045 [Smallanthus sonchifolius]